ncbi:MAG TPA: LysM domain-containing protein [Promineifilum sp.]|nr:LysM domain-containing protein [Promineifilum sp.]
MRDARAGQPGPPGHGHFGRAASGRDVFAPCGGQPHAHANDRATGPPAEPTPPPAVDPTAPPAQETSPTGEVIHTVQAGENLFRIGLRYGFTAAELAAYNGIANPNVISVGQQIRIPPRP